MREAFGDIWEMDGDGLCILTNRCLRKDGRAIMGGGIAKQALQRYPRIDNTLGQHLVLVPNNLVTTLVLDTIREQRIISFPTKRDWKDDADLELIRKSAHALMRYIDAHRLGEVLLPRPGCGLGNLDYQIVKSEIEPILDDRVVVVTYEEANVQEES
jgi:hypothetical protein